MKKYLLLSLTAFLPLCMTAQNSLSGTIKNEQGEPVQANIYLPQFEKGTLSDFEGVYEINQIPNGAYTVVVSSLGYETQSVRLEFDSTQSVVQDFMMKESIVEMEEVIISTPFHKLQSDNVMKVERVTTKDLTKSGAINLSEGITNIAGVSSISTGNAIGKPVIRGLSANRVLTYAQGVRLENQQFGDEHGLGINGAGVSSVEVIKGPASLLYGSDALGGVLYLNPESFASVGETTLSGNGGYFSNAQAYNTSWAVKSSQDKLKWMARVTRSSSADYETGNKEKVTNSRSNETDFNTGLRFQNNRWKSTLRYNYNRSTIGIPEEIGAQSNNRTPLLPFQIIDNHILSWENNVFFNTSSLDIKAGYLFNDRKEFEETTDEAALRMKLKTFNYDVKYHLPLMDRFETIAGIQGMFQSNENLGEEILIPDAEKTDFGVFATTHYHLTKLDLQMGVRYDFRSITTQESGDDVEGTFTPAINRDFSSFNAALGGKYNFGEKITARLNIASGYRAPNLAELASNGVHEGTNRYEIGNPNLKNEQNIQTDLVLEYKSPHFEAFVNGFYNIVSNYIFIAPTGEIIEEEAVFLYEQFDSKLYGGELGFHWHPHPWDWLHWESSFETVTGKLNSGGFLPLIPANQFKNTLRFEWESFGKLNSPYGFITLQNTLDQNSEGTFETPTDGYNLLSLGFGSDLKWGDVQLNWGVSMTNLTDEVYINHLSRLKIDDIANPGRSINVNLGISL